MSAHLSKNMICTQFEEDDIFIGGNVMKEDSVIEEDMTFKKQTEDNMSCLSVLTVLNNVSSSAIRDGISSTVGDGIVCMDGSITKPNNIEIGKTAQDNGVCIDQVQVQNSTTMSKVTQMPRKRG